MITNAKLLKDGTVKACSASAHFNWLEFGPGKRLSKLRYDRIQNYSIETRFSGKSSSPDGPHLFWSLEVIKYTDSFSYRAKDPSGGFLTALKDTLTPKCTTIQQLFDAQPEAIYAEQFATREEALASHIQIFRCSRWFEHRCAAMPYCRLNYLNRYWLN